jgi:hypothetical protein
MVLLGGLPMPVEHVGEAGTEGADREWIVAQATLAIRHLIKVCGPPPAEMELEIQWQEHELGEYPLIVLTWEDGMRGAPWKYINRCAEALEAFEDGEGPPKFRRTKSWTRICTKRSRKWTNERSILGCFWWSNGLYFGRCWRPGQWKSKETSHHISGFTNKELPPRPATS